DRWHQQDGRRHRTGRGNFPYAGSTRYAADGERTRRHRAQSDLFNRGWPVAVRNETAATSGTQPEPGAGKGTADFTGQTRQRLDQKQLLIDGFFGNCLKLFLYKKLCNMRGPYV